MQISLMSISSVFIKSPIKSSNSIEIVEFLLANKVYGVALMSKFVSFNKNCQSFKRFNPYNYIDFAKKLECILIEKGNKFIENDVNILSENSLEKWFQTCLNELQESIIFSKNAIMMKFNCNSFFFQKIAAHENFKHLDYSQVIINFFY